MHQLLLVSPSPSCCIFFIVCLFGFYGISSFVGYLMLNPFYTNKQIYQTIQFSISAQFDCQKHFYFKQFSLVKQFYFKQISSNSNDSV